MRLTCINLKIGNYVYIIHTLVPELACIYYRQLFPDPLGCS